MSSARSASFAWSAAARRESSTYCAAAIYALNPNLLYMQTTAMNEPIFLAFFIWDAGLSG